MKRLICSLIMSAAFVTPALAHPPGEDGGHDPTSRFRAPVAEQPRAVFTPAAAQAKAKVVVGTMIDRKIVGPSWRVVSPSAAKVREKDGAKEWMVTFRNDRERARAKRTLYVFLTESGEYKAANHTGV